MRTLLLALASALAGALLLALWLIPQLPAEEAPLNRRDFAAWPAPALDCQALRQQAWQTATLPNSVDDRSQDKLSAFVSRRASAPQQALQLFGVYGGMPRIELGAGAQPANLLLTSYDRSIWNLSLASDADIRRIFVADAVAEVRLQRRADPSWGGRLKRALGLTRPLATIELVKLSRVQTCSLYGYAWQNDEKAQFRSLIAATEQVTGLQVQSFQGSYAPALNSPPFATPLATPSPTTPAPPAAVPVTAVAEAAPAPANAAQVHSVDDLRNVVRQLIERGVLPPRLASMDMASGGTLLELQPLDLASRPAIVADARGQLVCPSHGDSALQGDDGPNIAECGFGNTQFYGGGGKDLLDDAWGNDLIYGGSGDDSLDAGWGADVLLFERGWGHDILDKTCHNARFDAASTPGAAQLEYRWRFNNFIVFGPGIAPADLTWDGNLLRHRNGDSLEFKGGNACFNLVFADDPSAELSSAAR
ncbi:hypothetical protein JQX08_21905 [Pseudomonas sp. UL073]|uniref:Hemolysin-type calcium-binding repeat-containing protein n=1 Tax=Zestomonas insulae TaxID=2809017 RepID=A0ABS2IMF8_9GAMM|nr:hypothetical protein [Pseudomonas insulae]MBM7063383.1 hypothetical protein [Pseudomonas insulae]